MSANQIDSEQAFSGVAQTGNMGNATSVSSGAAKIFREFKWGLLTLFILMTVVVCLVYDGGRSNKKKTEIAQAKPTTTDTTSAGEVLPTVGSDSTVVGIAPTPTAPVRADDSRDLWRSESALGNQPRRNASSDSSSHLYDPVNDERPVTQPTTPTVQTPEGSKRTARTNAKSPVSADRDQPRDRETATPAPASGFKWYVVKSGDNLTRIANTNLPGKGGNKAITDANKDTLPDPNKLREGMKIRIPNSITAVAVNDGKTRASDKPSDENRSDILRQKSPKTAERHGDSNIITQDDYVVQAGDTMERIARKVLNDSKKWKDLLDWNKDRVADASKLKIGTVLRTHPVGQHPTLQPLITDGLHRRQHTVRADAEPQPADITDTKGEPIADEIQLPIHPIAAVITAPADKAQKLDAPKSKKASKSEKNDTHGQEDDTIVRAQILQ
ncbi:MAG: LysM peptidoglycan-binding domain-containing protein [Planctomycetota bacterium]